MKGNAVWRIAGDGGTWQSRNYDASVVVCSPTSDGKLVTAEVRYADGTIVVARHNSAAEMVGGGGTEYEIANILAWDDANNVYAPTPPSEAAMTCALPALTLVGGRLYLHLFYVIGDIICTVQYVDSTGTGASFGGPTLMFDNLTDTMSYADMRFGPTSIVQDGLNFWMMTPDGIDYDGDMNFAIIAGVDNSGLIWNVASQGMMYNTAASNSEIAEDGVSGALVMADNSSVVKPVLGASEDGSAGIVEISNIGSYSQWRSASLSLSPLTGADPLPTGPCTFFKGTDAWYMWVGGKFYRSTLGAIPPVSSLCDLSSWAEWDVLAPSDASVVSFCIHGGYLIFQCYSLGTASPKSHIYAKRLTPVCRVRSIFRCLDRLKTRNAFTLDGSGGKKGRLNL